uniref:Scaffold protein n=1 Tax=Microviridae sp. ct2OM3 TaxID=2826724 RepID=A0A8S5NM73_9VIRU|nr:MAG TPA: Scaffold protein [Microviridae sp. ct2OM3]
MLPFIRSPYNYDTDEVSRETGLDCSADEPLTQQQFAEETDINTIVRRFGLTGQLPDDYRAPMEQDFFEITDFSTAMQAVRKAQEQFLQLPGDMRARFANDPQRLLDFLEDPTNRDEALKLGLLQKPPEKTRDAVQAIDELTKSLTSPPKP